MRYIENDADWDDLDDQTGNYADDPEAYEPGFTSDSYDPDNEWDNDYMEEFDPQAIEIVPLSSILARGPGPGMIAIATIAMCLLLVGLWLAISGPATLALTAADETTHAIATQAALQQTAQAAAPGLAGASQADAGAVPADCTVSDLFPNKVRRWCGLITQYAAKHDMAPDLVAALIWLESGGNETAYSRSGAVGLMQVMPSDGLAASFSCINGPCFSDRPTTAQLQDPEFNIAFGTRMLAGLIRKNGGLREALKSYGPMDVGYTYADKVIGIFQRHTK